MKTILFTIVFLVAPLASANVNAETGAHEADYEVPAPEALKDFANFKIKVNQAYGGAESKMLSYTFPAELTGMPELTVTLRRVPGTENSWTSLEMNAECIEDKDLFTCEMFLNKKPAAIKNKNVVDLNSIFSGNMVMQSSAPSDTDTFINKKSAVDFLNTNAIAMSLSPNHLKNQLDILDKFLSNEPAGILSSKFTPYGK